MSSSVSTPVHSADQLRSRLLNNLGIMQPMPMPPATPPIMRKVPHGHILQEPLKEAPNRTKTKNFGSTLLAGIASFLAANNTQGKDVTKKDLLQSSDLPNLDACSDGSSSCSSDEDEKQHGVTFDEVVTVIPIPRADQYSHRIRVHLWDSPQVVQANIIRNSLEFAADGYDPLNVCEEEDHALCPTTGKLIHPIHFELAKVLRKKRGHSEAATVETLLQTL